MEHLQGLLLAAVALCAAASSDALNETSSRCWVAADQLSTRLPGHTWRDLMSQAPVSGQSLSLCPSPRTCCTVATERKLQEAAWDHFRSHLRSATAVLRASLADSAAKFRERFRVLLTQAERNTLLVFSDVYAERMAAAAQAPVRQLFAALESHLMGHDGTKPESQLNVFFDELFPLVYFHTVNPKLNDFNDEYKGCLRSVQGRLRPFGDVPTRLQGPLVESISASRTLLRTINAAMEVLNVSSNPTTAPSPPCSRALARLMGCPACVAPGILQRRGSSPSLCWGLCLNSLRSCLAGLENLGDPWADMVSALDHMLSRMVGTNDLEEALSVLDSKVSEAVMHAMENGAELSKRVKLECGDPKRRPGNSSWMAAESGTRRTTAAVALRGPDTSLRAQQRLLNHTLGASRKLFTSLADTVCAGPGLDATHRSPCWNGHGMGKYTKMVVDAGTKSQNLNPEASYQASLWDSELDLLAIKLNDITTEILSSKVSAMPESDSYTMEGSGSGAWAETSDDEDFDSGSGSGMGDKSAPAPTATVATAPPKKEGSGTGSPGASATAVATLLCLLWTAWSATAAFSS